MTFVVLLPPSEGKTVGGDKKPLSDIHPVTQTLLDEIKTKDPEKLYSARKQEAAKLNANVKSAPSMPAIKRYSGVVYKALDYDSLTNKKWVDTHVRIISGLFGLITPQTLLPNYKLPITKLSAAKKWHDSITSALKKSFVIDLLPKAHKKAVSYENGVKIAFTLMRNGKTVSAGHAGKTIKGMFVRWMAKQNITDVDDIYAFSADGYAWNGKAFHKN